MSISVNDLWWAAGIMEGEGSFGLRRHRDLVAAVGMTDKDVIDRVESVFGFGSRKERVLPSGKTFFTWLVTNQIQAAGLMMTLLPLMGIRRATKIIECLSAWKEKPLPKRMWTSCKNGHELSGSNVKHITEGKYVKRRCVECGKLRQRKYRASVTWNASGIFAL